MMLFKIRDLIIETLLVLLAYEILNMLRNLLVFSLFVVSAQGTQLSELPEQFLGMFLFQENAIRVFAGLISNEIKQFYSNLTAEERAIIDIVDANTRLFKKVPWHIYFSD